ncbi:MAG TPA: DUF3047 domain-containing protein [Burkholderiales bacterium]|nr:DUF3047 domain-containing protein [Burkholderiales bacterium]
MARAHAVAALALLAGCAMIEHAPERVFVMTTVTKFSSGERGRTLPSGWRAWTEWQEEVRNIYEDYEHTFGEESPMTRSVGVMTDTDNTGEKVHAYHGDISFQCAARP